MKPLLCYTGSKRNLADRVTKYVQHGVFFPDAYWQPLCGAACVFFALKKRTTCAYHLSDTNFHVVNFHTQVRDKPQDLVKAILDLKSLYERHANKQGIFKYYRNEMNARKRGPVELAALLYVVPRLSFKHLLRFNSHGCYSGSHDKTVLKLSVIEDDVLNASEHLQGVSLTVGDFKSVTPKATDVVYIDPPPKVPTLDDLQPWLTSLPCRWALSSTDTPQTRQVFKGFCFHVFADTKSKDCVIVDAKRRHEGSYIVDSPTETS